MRDPPSPRALLRTGRPGPNYSEPSRRGEPNGMKSAEADGVNPNPDGVKGVRRFSVRPLLSRELHKLGAKNREADGVKPVADDVKANDGGRPHAKSTRE